MSQLDGRNTVATPQWKYWAGTRLGRELSTFMSPYKEVDRTGEVHAFHLQGEDAQADAAYWVATARSRRNYLPRRFGAYVHRSGKPNVALVIEPQPDKRRYAVVQIAFESEDDIEPTPIRNHDLRTCPLDRWARLAAKAIMHTAQHNHPTPGKVTLRDRHEEADHQHVHIFDLADKLDRAVASAAPTKRREVTDENIQAVVPVYRAEMKRATTEGGHARPTERVAEALYISRATAGRWIKLARERGLLGEATGRRAGEAPPTK